MDRDCEFVTVGDSCGMDFAVKIAETYLSGLADSTWGRVVCCRCL